MSHCALQEHDADLLVRSANSWTPLHYAAAYNKVTHPLLLFGAVLPTPLARPVTFHSLLDKRSHTAAAGDSGV